MNNLRTRHEAWGSREGGQSKVLGKIAMRVQIFSHVVHLIEESHVLLASDERAVRKSRGQRLARDPKVPTYRNIAECWLPPAGTGPYRILILNKKSCVHSRRGPYPEREAAAGQVESMMPCVGNTVHIIQISQQSGIAWSYQHLINAYDAGNSEPAGPCLYAVRPMEAYCSSS